MEVYNILFALVLKLYYIINVVAKFKIILFSTYFFSIPNYAFAYLDPGMGSMILQFLAFILAAGLAFLSVTWQKIKTFFKNLSEKKSKTSKNESEKKNE